MRVRSRPIRLLICTSFAIAAVTARVEGQGAARFPVPPAPLTDSLEIELARSAAPPEISDSADIVAIRGGAARIIRRGTSGAACMVARDSHQGSLYPMCFNPEAVRTAMQRELLQMRLRMDGASEDSVDRATAAATASGMIPVPTRFAIAYMMSPRQVLYSSPSATGVRVGAWYPHVMIYSPNLADRDVGIARRGPGLSAIQLTQPGTHHTELVIVVPKWADGSASQARQ